MVLSLKRWKSRSSPGIEARATCKHAPYQKPIHNFFYTYSLTGTRVPIEVSLRWDLGAGWSSPVARQAHNLKVTGSNPVPATILMEQPLPPLRAALSFVPSYVAFELLSVRDGGISKISAERSTFLLAAWICRASRTTSLALS
jgi:hypothetical protein